MNKPPKKTNSKNSGGQPASLAPVRLSFDLYNARFIVRERPQVVPTAGIFDSPFACIRVNFDWLVHLYGALDALTQRDGWQGDDTQVDFALQQIEALMNAMQKTTGCIELGENTLLRQNPANPCQLQQSADGGVTWTLAFDYSLCRNEGSIISNNMLIFNQGSTYNTNNVNTWNESNQNVNTFAPTVIYNNNPQENLNRDKALCFAIQALMGTMKQALLQSDDPFADITAVVAGVLAAVAVSLSSGALIPIVVAAFASSGGVQLAYNGVGDLGFGGAFVEQFDQIVCYIYNKLKGETVTFERFNTALVGYPDPNFDAIITPVVFNDLQVYLNFIRAMEEGYRLSQFATLPDCPCETVIEYRADYGTIVEIVGNQITMVSGADSFGKLVIYLSRYDQNNIQQPFQVTNIEVLSGCIGSQEHYSQGQGLYQGGFAIPTPADIIYCGFTSCQPDNQAISVRYTVNPNP